MRKLTSIEYQSIAESFYNTHLEGEPPTAKRLKKALMLLQDKYRPNYWRKLKIAIAHDQEKKGYKDVAEKIRRLVNKKAQEAIKNKDYGQLKPRQKVIKKVSKDDNSRIVSAINDKGDGDIKAAYILSKYTGCRPAEMNSVRVENGEVVINGAKVSRDRGFKERRLQVDKGALPWIEKSAKRLLGRDLGPIQDRFGRLMEKTFPRRKHRPTLYSFRHQMCSDLKRSGMGRDSIAYCMGHLSTKSQEAYGNRKTGGFKALIKPSEVAELLGELGKVKNNHRTQPWSSEDSQPQQSMEEIISNAPIAHNVPEKEGPSSLEQSVEHEPDLSSDNEFGLN